MTREKIAIIGGGLAGLYAANRLHRMDVDFDLYEARDRLGGRILSTPGSGLDLGPTWYWPDFQPRMHQLVDELGLSTFEQFETGDALVERWAMGVTRRNGYRSGNLSMRIVGGATRLTQALAEPLPSERIHLQKELLAARIEGNKLHISLSGEQPHGDAYSHLWLALPPRLARRIQFTPALSLQEMNTLANTPTWMASHAKYVAHYARPFWREKGLSGDAFSGVGPLGEVHDAGNSQHAALFGFFGIDALNRSAISASELKAHCRSQLVRLFGEEAGHPVDDYLQDWAKELFTSMEEDQVPPAWHGSQDLNGLLQGQWKGRLSVVGSEASAEQGGYMEGAILAVDKAIQQLQAGSREA